MKWLKSYKIRLMVTAFIMAFVHGTGRTEAHIIMSDPVSVGPPIVQGYDPQGCDFSVDGLELYFASTRPGGYGSWDIWVSKRDSLNDPWQEPVNLGPSLNNGGGQVYPTISPDGLELYFDRWQNPYLYVSRRVSRDTPWSTPEKVLLFDNDNELNEYAQVADVSGDGLSLYFSTRRGGNNDPLSTWVAHRVSPADPWFEPVALTLDGTGAVEPAFPSITADGLTLIFGSDGSPWLWATSRRSVEDDWGPPIPFESITKGYDAAISPDGSTLYIDVYNPHDVRQVTFTPLVDFDNDGMVDIGDILVLIEHWGQAELYCDVAPLPLGDGVVDEKDLEMLMSYWGQEQHDPTLIAHWRLDEAEGNFAYDSAGNNDALVIGGAVWHPTGGQINGALQLDGVDDFISIPAFFNTADGPFSVLVWVKGGAPGQVVISEADGSNWLSLEPLTGYLMTELTGPGRSPAPLLSETAVTDGNWHRIGFVWDGSSRILYVNDMVVAQDPKSSLDGSSNDLYIGTGKGMEPGSFFSGLIDEVRIYNRVVAP